MKIFKQQSNVVLALLCGLYFILYIDRTNLGTAAPAIKAELGLTNTEIGIAFSGFAYAYLAFQLIGGWLGDRFGPRKVLACSVFVFATATVLTGFVGSLTSLVLMRVLLGLGEGSVFTVGTRAQVLWMPKEKFGWAQGITHSFSRLGNVFAPMAVAWLIIAASWRVSFIALGLASFIWVFFWLWLYRERSNTVADSERNFGTKEEAVSSPVPWGSLFIRMLPVIMVMFCFAWSTWTYLNWLPSFFLNNFHLNLKSSAMFAGGAFLAGVVGNTLGGTISDRIFHCTGSALKARSYVIATGLTCAGIFLMPLLFIRDQFLITTCLVAALFSTEMIIAALWTIPMHIAPKFSGLACGMMNCGYATAGILSPIVYGWIVDRTGDWQLPFAVSISLLFVGAVITFWMRPDKELKT